LARKIAFIVVWLTDETVKMANHKVEAEILRKLKQDKAIPWLAKVEKVVVSEV
jgi:hypothetical protein